MGKRGSGEVAEAILDTVSAHPNEYLSVQDISKAAGVSWESTKRYLELFTRLNILRGTQESGETGKTMYQKIHPLEPDTLFSIPLSEEHKITIRKIYATIQSLWGSISDRPLTKTLVQKIAVDVAGKQYPDIPRGWYLYGEVLLLPFELGQQYAPALESQEDVACVRTICLEYSACCNSSYQIRKHQYEKKNNALYLIKDTLYYWLAYTDFSADLNKNKIRQALNQFAVSCKRKESNSAILAIVDDFCATTLSIFRNASDSLLDKARPLMLESFGAVWQLVATYELYDSLSALKFYDKNLLADYLFEKIKAQQEVSIEALEGLHEINPKPEFPDDEITRKLRALMGSAKELSPEEKKKRLEEMAEIQKTQGEAELDKFLSETVGLNL